MKDLILQKLEEKRRGLENKKAEEFILNKLGENPTIKQVENLIIKIKEDANN